MCGGSLREETNSLGGLEEIFGPGANVERRQAKWSNLIDLFHRNFERLPARRDNGEVGALLEQGDRGRCTGVAHAFTIVQHDEDLSAAHRPGENLLCREAPRECNIEGRGYRFEHVVAVGCREVYHADFDAGGQMAPVCGQQRDSCFAHSSRSRQCDQAALSDVILQPVQVLFPTDEAGVTAGNLGLRLQNLTELGVMFLEDGRDAEGRPNAPVARHVQQR